MQQNTNTNKVTKQKALQQQPLSSHTQQQNELLRPQQFTQLQGAPLQTTPPQTPSLPQKKPSYLKTKSIGVLPSSCSQLKPQHMSLSFQPPATTTNNCCNLTNVKCQQQQQQVVPKKMVRQNTTNLPTRSMNRLTVPNASNTQMRVSPSMQSQLLNNTLLHHQNAISNIDRTNTPTSPPFLQSATTQQIIETQQAQQTTQEGFATANVGHQILSQLYAPFNRNNLHRGQQVMYQDCDTPTLTRQSIRPGAAISREYVAISGINSPEPFSEAVSEYSIKAHNGGGYFQTEILSSSKSARRRGSDSFQPLILASTFMAPRMAEAEKLTQQQNAAIVAAANPQNHLHYASETDLVAPTSMSIVKQADQQDSPKNREFTPKRDFETGIAGKTAGGGANNNSHIQGQLSRVISVSPYQKGNTNGVTDPQIQKRMFTRPKNRMLASTAPADRLNVINIQNLPFLHPMPDQSHEFHPIREGRQMSLLFEQESSAGNTSFHNTLSLPINDATLQPTSKAFSTTGIRHQDEHSSSHQNGGDQNDFDRTNHKHRMQRSSHSKQSHSAAGDIGLAMMQHDESMELLDEEATHQYHAQIIHHNNNEQDQHEVVSVDPNQTIKLFKFVGCSQQLVNEVLEVDEDNNQGCLRVVNAAIQQQLPPDSIVEKHQLQLLNKSSAGKGVPSPQLLPKSRPRQDVEIMQTRMRLHSNFTSIDRRPFIINCKERGRYKLQSRADLVADTNALQTDQTVFALEGSKTTQKFKLEPRIKRQAQSIINRRRSERIMQTITMKEEGTMDCWQDNQSTNNFLQRMEQQTDPAPSICESCHERIVGKKENSTLLSKQEDIDISPNHHRRQLERSVQLNRTVQIMRFGKNEHHDDANQSSVIENEDRRSLSDRMHYATSSYSSNRFCFKDSDHGSKSAKSKINHLKRISRRGNKEDGSQNKDEEEQRSRGQKMKNKKKNITGTNMVSNRSSHDNVRVEIGSDGRRAHHLYRGHHHRDHGQYYLRKQTDQRRPSNSPSQSRKRAPQHHTRLQDKQNYKSGGHSANLSNFSSTKFPNMAARTSQRRGEILNVLANRGPSNSHRQQRSRSRSRLLGSPPRHQRDYSRSRSGSKTPPIIAIRRQETLPMGRNLNLQKQDSQSAVGSSHRSTNQKGRRVENFSQYRRTNTLNTEDINSARRNGTASKCQPETQQATTCQVENKSRSSHQRRMAKNHDTTYNKMRSGTHHHRDNPHHIADTHSSNNSGRRSRRHEEKYETANSFQNNHRHHHHLHLHRRMTTPAFRAENRNNFFDCSRNGRQAEKNHYGGQSKRAAADYQDMKDAFYSSKRHNYQRQQSSRGKGSFKTQKYRQRRSRSRNLSSLSSRAGRSMISSYSRGPPISSFKHSKKYPSQHSTDSPVNQATTNAQVDRSKDAGHFEWRKNMTLESCNQSPKQIDQPATVVTEPSAPDGDRPSSKYQVVDHLGDGTFGRALKCVEIQQTLPESQGQSAITNNNQLGESYAVKVVRAVPRYAESAKFEAQILQDLQKQGGCDRGIVYLKETFINKSKQSYGGNISNMCLVFEPLGKSLYDFIKDNGYKGFEISQVREIAIQALNAIEFLHSLKLTHTDLKPENILLKYDNKETLTDEVNFPIQVQSKRSIYGSQKCSEVDDSSYFSGQSASVQNRRKWSKPASCEIKVIDFGGATYEHERHTLIINTRQYRAPEVILENITWNEKTDIWSMACILIELYTGELFFDTDENLEHLAMIEKQCGSIPLSMAQRCGNEQIKKQLHKEGSSEEEQYVKNKKMRLRWPAASLRASSRQAVSNMLMLDDIINDKWGEQHRMFKDLLKFMLKIDPKERPSASECLNHYFFNDVRKLSKSTEKTQVSTADHQFESPRLKHQ